MSEGAGATQLSGEGAGMTSAPGGGYQPSGGQGGADSSGMGDMLSKLMGGGKKEEKPDPLDLLLNSIVAALAGGNLLTFDGGKKK